MNRRTVSVGALGRARGASLIEVLVAILILSFGMLAMAGLHAVAFKYGKMSQFRGVATQLAIDLSDRMRANVTGAIAGQYVYTEAYDREAEAVTIPTCADTTRCTSAEMAALDLAQMRNTVRLALPGGALFVQQDAAAANVYNIWVLWLDPEAPGSDEDSDAASFSSQCDGIDADAPLPQCMPMRIAL
ncbi:type IV pilus modification protein PilV [Schlegelella sp. S2-27]|uniref:Type IV pilus modification protein PilV n=1 Tax=Caldimonas mangrovi TaxID=2944811 RepID=A0ABT0YLP8_9BURK|nr:type IV pilus modification protein PilV [Caldimonas mangrovi]MCM5679657.1 type IV pilus modification protein PilV [Caldimonas mangrovi]